MQEFVLFDFSKKTKITDWQIINDAVMGGISKGNLSLTPEGYGLFEGKISLANYGGFSSLRHRFKTINSSDFHKFILRIKGDKKRYQFRVKTALSDDHSYIFSFQTNGEWQNIEIPFNEMYASFRGRKLQYPNYPGMQMQEISVLVGNQKEEIFKLLIDNIKIDK